MFVYEAIDAPRRLVLTEPRSGIQTEIRLDSTDGGTSVRIRQRRLPPPLQADSAREGLAGVLDQLDVVTKRIAESRKGR
ncbi:SRPBCC family protein [Nocardia farcinica]|uniref:Activator of Hsp90 ATPase homolog 1-like protein n=1 Tax=Nocardia farcinica TaxID=37329 RepID=A0A0H5P5F4_NOCFR|nr:SRPBCC domain-containing protein [Nocardia farcinica]CRY82758.1 Activator of Hsp90 ATPase homolog 1-like protein [Nocardia farcinica]SIT26433.1 Activator of Hsp90 ATPase homolog 1-like protein [Nocardia farcinica]SUE32430.1 Activator of Hsp90 ATPase homolog 1-like protein [Nocardia farcinica]